MTSEELWKAALGELELLISKANFTTWFKNTRVISFSNDRALLAVPNAFTKAYLEKKYHQSILKALQNIAGANLRLVEYQVELNIASTTVSAPQIQSNTELVVTTIPPNVNLFGLNPKHTLDTFVVGKHNELARAAALAVAQKPGLTYNPLYIYGGVGLGKTHLMQAIAFEMLKIMPGARVLYVPCERFTTDFIQSISAGKTEKFKNTYRTVDLLIIDDIQFLSGKEGTQEEFFHTFNALHQAGKQIVISSDRPPKAIYGVESRLISRFEWGMIADIGTPDLETRVAILNLKCEEKKYQLSNEIINFIASNIQQNVRELEGALNRLIAHQSLVGEAPTIDIVKNLIQHLATSPTLGGGITPKKILGLVAEYYDLPTTDLVGISRKKNLVFSRQIAMYLMREILKTSFPVIGQEFGGRDHTTAMHACLKISQETSQNKTLAQDIHNLTQLINK